MLRLKYLAAVLAFMAMLAAPASAAQQEVVFGIISTESSQNQRKVWEPFLKDMEERTGFTIKPFFVSDYAGVIEGMRFNKVHVAWTGNKGAMEAVDRAEAEVFAQSVAADGLHGYYSHLIAHVDSPLTSEKDVIQQAGELRFSNGDPNSTSGFLVPSYYVFALNNVDARKIFKHHVTANHEANILAVANKQVDVATCSSEGLNRINAVQPEKRKLIKVIWTSPLIPSDPLIRRKDLPADVKEKLADFIFSYGVSGSTVEQDRAVLKDLGWSPFRKSSDAQLIPFRQLELFREKAKLEGDTEMNPAERDRKLAEINAQLADLEKAAAAQPAQ
jgi:phosphonate transport system substrate-binding protein